MDKFLRHIIDKIDEPIAPMYGPPPVCVVEEKRVVDKKNIVFDFGGVVMQHNAEGCVAAFNEIMGVGATRNILGLGLEPERFTEEYYIKNRWRDRPLNYLFELGRISKKEFIKRVLEYCTDGTTEQQVIDAWNIMHAGVPGGTWMKIKLLRNKGYHTYLMSNTNEIHWQHTLSLYKYQIETLFDEVFLSFKIGAIKPDERFFESVDKRIHADPKQTYFVDDMEENRLAAKKHVKWQTCADFKELIEILK